MSDKLVPASYQSNRRSRADIERIVEEFKSSGLTSQEFATQHRLSVSTLRVWVSRVRKGSEPEPPAQWVEVNLPPSGSSPGSRRPVYQIALAGGVLSVPSGFEPAEVKELLSLLGAEL